MRRRRGPAWRGAVAAGVLAAVACGEAPPAGGAASADAWVATWATAPQLTEPRNMPPEPGLANRTLRQALRVSIGGDRLRVRWSNEYGSTPMVIHEARLAASLGGGRIDPTTERGLTFGGRAEVTLAPGETAVSDPTDFALEPMADVALTTAFGEVPADLTGHPGSRTTSYILPENTVGAASMAAGVTTDHWYAMTGIDVVAPQGAAVAILGNSITDGRGSTTNEQDRWPDMLSRRLRADPSTAHVAVLNLGTGGNCVLRACLGPAGVERFGRDILDQAGVRWVIVLEGVNDIGGARGAAASDSVAGALIEAYQEMIERAHARGLRVYGATITPFGESFYDSPEHEAARARVNAWIRTSGAFDAVIDFDEAVRDPAAPTRLRSDADTGDHLHPDAEGYRIMGGAIPLALFREP